MVGTIYYQTMKILSLLFFLSMTIFVQAQGFHGYVENENKEAIIGAKISCGKLLIASAGGVELSGAKLTLPSDTAVWISL